MQEIRRVPSATELLRQRATYGKIQHRNHQYDGDLNLASVIAWSPNRMRNTILAVGPGTPATVLWRTREETETEDDDSSDDDGSEDDDDDDDDDDDVMDSDSEEQSEDDPDTESPGPDSEAEELPQMLSNWLHAMEEDGSNYSPGLREDLGFLLRQNRRPRRNQQRTDVNWSPSLRHSGCINTACWMNGTDLMTSGDDRLIKIWDVGASLGSASLQAGGWDTFAPLAMSPDPSPHTVERLDQHHTNYAPSGSVNLLQTLVTGHRGNVFHITPCHDRTKILSCAADGYLRLIDRVKQTSSVVVDSDGASNVGYSSLGMAFCHELLTANTGLLCSENGLLRFDVRAPRTHQLLISGTCKAVAMWPPRNGVIDPTTEPNMVFVGRSSSAVELLDLRMAADGEQLSHPVLQRYSPFATRKEAISVSGLDVSKDGRELLVSYESDQIYAFPIFGSCSCKAGPTLEDLDASAQSFSDTKMMVLPSASYGGHFNRLTFLKNAKYAGPRDEYIVTGSDSGNAWFFERATGAVAALLSADRSTCNGVVPHPELPVFATYGIESTAKLWRAAPLVDRRSDDGPKARYRSHLQPQSPHDFSRVTESWDYVQSILTESQQYIFFVMPDFADLPDEILSSLSSHVSWRMSGDNSPFIGNALRNLPSVLRQNQYQLCKTFQAGVTTPVLQSVLDFHATVAKHRTKLQAEQLGLRWNAKVPWCFGLSGKDYIHKADVIPHNPSDWILADCRVAVMLADAGPLVKKTTTAPYPWLSPEDSQGRKFPDSASQLQHVCDLLHKTALLAKEGGNEALKAAESSKQEKSYDASRSLLFVAARRYDTAIQYCAVVLMNHADCNTPLEVFKKNSALWDPSPFKQVLVATRLNLALLHIRNEQPGRAVDHATAALRFAETSPMIAKAHFRLGCALMEQGHWMRAAEHLEVSLKRQPNDAVVRRRLEQVQRRLLQRRQRKRKKKVVSADEDR